MQRLFPSGDHIPVGVLPAVLRGSWCALQDQSGADMRQDISPLSSRKGIPVGNGKAGERIIVYRNRIANQKNVLTITPLHLPLQAKELWFRNPATSLEDFEEVER